jgi:hypothetical protein
MSDGPIWQRLDEELRVQPERFTVWLKACWSDVLRLRDRTA